LVLPVECGVNLHTNREKKIKMIVDKLKKTGIDNLVSQILKAFAKKYPQYQGHGFPREFFDYFWASEYDIAPMDPHHDHELAVILTQVEARVALGV